MISRIRALRPAMEFALALLCGTGLARLLDRPWVAAMTAACFYLPPWTAALIYAWRLPAEITVTLDPLQPDPASLAHAFRSAAKLAAASGSPAILCINPLYGGDGSPVPVSIVLNAKRELLCSAGDRKASGFRAPAWLPRHPLPITVGGSPVLIRFTTDPDKRLSTRIVTPLSDSLALGLQAGVCIALLPFSGPAALAAAAALLLRWRFLRAGSA